MYVHFDASDILFGGNAIGKRYGNQFDHVLHFEEQFVEVWCVGHYRPDVVLHVMQTQMCQCEFLVPIN